MTSLKDRKRVDPSEKKAIRLAKKHSTSPTSSPRSSYLSALVLGLLSSSCCVVQLFLNLFSIGCAGFSVLTQFRPLFLSISGLLMLYTLFKYRFSARTVLTLAITLFLTATPEMVSVYNQSSSLSPLIQLNNNLSIGPFYIWSTVTKQLAGINKATTIKMADTLEFCGVTKAQPGAAEPKCGDGGDSGAQLGPLSSAPVDVSFEPKALIKYEIHVEGMACEACANRLRQHFKNRPGLAGVSVFFKDKKLVLWTTGGQKGGLMLSEKAIQEMVAQVDLKYSAQLLSVSSVQSQEDS
ncbi:hypothetical protein EMPS_04719 [Entomortierella parvispora]|uniref:HMA domain-containing protein n=1 Tax=Entomortierella parvispora TaxID=205924 RepID=A0A9P3H9R5_9FUNG|nr:hypothetical protein EMPS_04719 [Entomortierella parvispora]